MLFTVILWFNLWLLCLPLDSKILPGTAQMDEWDPRHHRTNRQDMGCSQRSLWDEDCKHRCVNTWTNMIQWNKSVWDRGHIWVQPTCLSRFQVDRVVGDWCPRDSTFPLDRPLPLLCWSCHLGSESLHLGSMLRISWVVLIGLSWYFCHSKVRNV